MILDLTLRSTEMQTKYQEDMLNGKSEDITQIKPDAMKRSLKVLNDRYPQDLLFKDVDNLIGVPGKDWEAFIEFGNLYFNDELEYDGYWLNSKGKMSQPKAWHIKGCNFNEDNIQFLRECLTHRKQIEFFLKDMR